MTERDIFIAALQKDDADARRAYLAEVCGPDSALRARVEELLAVHERAASFLESPPAGPAVTIDHPTAEEPGTVIGAYKLLQRIGEGGFGVVFMAEQTAPVRRKVALKVLKPGMDTRQVVARFEAERQALAIMDHPNIARVFDGGVTPSGRPYFVMELVRGVPITQFCDEHVLESRQRLELFVAVCQAVQHAHQKGIIHRDLKPSNVLVTVHDTTPVVKVIDFGVAKALGQELTDKTLFTGFAQMIGTPLYMSPEQAGQSGLDIDTRSDIYSLGVLLYELLTGTTPFTADRFKKAAYDEIRRIIREEEPPRPSTRLSESKDELPSVAAQRHTEPAKLTRLVRGELDWVVMKALEKDRSRRYETAAGFAADVQRYLGGEAVQAVPPSTGYRLRKFARRNKQVLATAGFIVLALLGSLVTLAVSNFVISQERDAKTTALGERQEALIQAQANKEAADTQRQRAEDNLQLAVNVLDQILIKPAERRLFIARREQGRLLAPDPERQQLDLELIEQGADFYAQFAKRNSGDPAAQLNAAVAYHWLAYYQHQMGQQEKSLQTCRQGLRFLEGLTPAQQDDAAHLQIQGDIHHLMYAPLFAMKRFEEAEEATRRGLAIFDKLAASTGPGRAYAGRHQMIWAHMNLGSLASQVGRNADAEQAFRKALAVSDDAIRADPGNLGMRFHKAKAGELLGAFYAKADRLDEAIEAWVTVEKEWTKLAQATGEPGYRWHVANSLETIGLLHQKASRFQDAEKKYAEALPVWEKLAAESNHPDHRFHLGYNRELAGYQLRKMGRLTEAAAAYQAAITTWEKLVAEFNHPDHRGHLTRSQSALKEVRSLQEKQAKDPVKKK